VETNYTLLVCSVRLLGVLAGRVPNRRYIPGRVRRKNQRARSKSGRVRRLNQLLSLLDFLPGPVLFSSASLVNTSSASAFLESSGVLGQGVFYTSIGRSRLKALAMLQLLR
jgi:hypothetical protein